MIKIVNEDYDYKKFYPNMVIGDHESFTLDFMARWYINKMNNRDRSIEDRNDINNQFRQYLNYDEDMFKLMVDYARKIQFK